MLRDNADILKKKKLAYVVQFLTVHYTRFDPEGILV